MPQHGPSPGAGLCHESREIHAVAPGSCHSPAAAAVRCAHPRRHWHLHRCPHPQRRAHQARARFGTHARTLYPRRARRPVHLPVRCLARIQRGRPQDHPRHLAPPAHCRCQPRLHAARHPRRPLAPLQPRGRRHRGCPHCRGPPRHRVRGPGQPAPGTLDGRHRHPPAGRPLPGRGRHHRRALRRGQTRAPLLAQPGPGMVLPPHGEPQAVAPPDGTASLPEPRHAPEDGSVPAP